jgi:hypothetical protein
MHGKRPHNMPFFIGQAKNHKRHMSVICSEYDNTNQQQKQIHEISDHLRIQASVINFEHLRASLGLPIFCCVSM